MIPIRWKQILITLVLVGCPTLAFIQGSRSSTTLNNSPKAVVDEAWQLIQREYVDRTFNGHDWKEVRQDYLDKTYTSPEQAYSAVGDMVALLDDEYTRFLSPQALKDLVSNVSGEFIGVGLTVSLDPGTKEWVVIQPFRESPAAHAGIRPDDVIVSVNGTETSKINPSKAAPYLIGPVGSKLKLQIRRDEENLEYELIREQINLNPLTFVAHQTPGAKIGYIRLPVFTSKSPAAMKNAIETLEKEKVQGYVLDLRGNPGGVLDAGIAIAREWIDKGRIMSLKTGDGKTEVYDANQTSLTSKPLQVLVDEKSASASEVLAAALQENQRGQLIGSQTFGKGVIQSLEKLGDDAGILITVAQYFTPSGKDIHKKGVAPDELADPSVKPSLNAEEHPFNQDKAYQQAEKNLLDVLQQVGSG